MHFNTSLAHSVLQDEYLSKDDDDGDTKTSHTVLVMQLLDFHAKTLTHICNR